MIRSLLLWFTSFLPVREIRGDDDAAYLERYFLFRFGGISAYIHRFVASDPGRDLHDHPWRRSFSVLLVGQYMEQRRAGVGSDIRCRTFNAPVINRINGTDFHRINITEGDEVWSLFVHGPKAKKWGFLTAPEIDITGRQYMVWMQHKYQDGDDAAGTWWKRCPTGRQLREKRQ